MTETQTADDAAFVEAEVRRLAIPDEQLQSLCRGMVGTFLPNAEEAARIIVALLKTRLGQGVAASLVRIGNSEGNAVGLTLGMHHPILLETFNVEFLDQIGIALGEAEARVLCARIRQALCAADVIGFRSINPRLPELDIISKNTASGLVGGPLGILYARTLLQDGLADGSFNTKLITSAWIHLTLIPSICDIMDAAQAVIVITGREALRPHFESRLGRRLRCFIAVPPQGYRPPTEDASHYRNAFPRVLDALDTDLRGTLVLVGAGLLGKLYCEAAKNSGTVAIDFGSGFDILAGVSTRPVHALVDIDALHWIR